MTNTSREALIERLRNATDGGTRPEMRELISQAAEMLEADKPEQEPVARVESIMANGRPFISRLPGARLNEGDALYMRPPAQQVAVSAGYVLVPIEPTDEAIELLYGPYLTYAADESRKRSYKEMLAAAQGAKP